MKSHSLGEQHPMTGLRRCLGWYSGGRPAVGYSTKPEYTQQRLCCIFDKCEWTSKLPPSVKNRNDKTNIQNNENH